MQRYIATRLLLIPVTLFAVTTVVFFLVSLSGNEVSLLLPPEASTADRLALQHKLGLDQPLPIQYAHYLSGAIHGDFGTSLYYQQPALDVALGRVPATLELIIFSIALAVTIGVGLGFAAAVMEGSWVDALAGLISAFGQSMPTFGVGLMLVLVFAVNLRWVPTSGSGTPEQLVLPVLTLAFAVMPTIMLITRTRMIEAHREPYVLVARAKGLSARRLWIRHVFRNGLNPIFSAIGLQLATLVGGTVIVETIFAWPGIGQLSVEAVANRDLPLVEAVVLLMAIGVVTTNLLVDMALAVVDVRTRVTQRS